MRYKVLYIINMNQPQEYLEDIRHIRAIMNRSTRFVALSGMTGIVSGTAALAVVILLSLYLGISPFSTSFPDLILKVEGLAQEQVLRVLITSFASLFLFSFFAAYFLTRRRAKAAGEDLWKGSGKQLWLSLGVPLLAGGGFCLALLQQGHVEMLAPASLIFYGVTLYSGSKFTLEEVKYLGVTEMVLGLLASFWPGLGLLLWAFGFGVSHIIYGIFMYNKYER